MGLCFSKDNKGDSTATPITPPGACAAPAADVKPVKPAAADMKAAHVLYVALKCDWKGNPDIKSIDDLKYGLGAGGMTAPWGQLEGLRSKTFTYCEKTDTVYGVYVFFNREALDKYAMSELFTGAQHWPHVSRVSYQIHDVMEGTELSIDQGAWPSADGKPSDFTDGAYMLHVVLTVDYSGNPDVPDEAAFRWGVKADGGKFPSFYVGMEGLRGKYFTMLQEDFGMLDASADRKADVCCGFYTFFSKEALDRYLESDLFKMHATFPQFAKIDYTVHEVLPGTERSMDLGAWPGADEKVP